MDIVTSGDPCQGNSVAGKRLGELDDRWLLDRAIEVFDQSGADSFFRENVPGNAGGQLAVAIPALERLGCRVAVGIFSSAETGNTMRRERLFILAERDRGGCSMRTAQTERADVLALIDEAIRVCRKNSLEDHHFQALRDKIAGGLHERTTPCQ